MKLMRKALSVLLAVVMLVPIMPAAFAGTQSGDVVADEICYNLLDLPVCVSNDAEAASEAPEMYKLFDEDGSYTIELEENAFFPYEIQFSYDDEVITKWFDTPESTADVAGHTFRVHSEYTDSDHFSQIGVYVGDTYVPARPAEKEFYDSAISTYTLLPHEKTYVNGESSIDLSKFLPTELKNVNLSAVLSESSIEVGEGDKVAWTDWGDDYKILNPGESINLYDCLNYNVVDLSLVIGSAKQLDSSNKYYAVTVLMPDMKDLFNFDLYSQNSTTRTKVDIWNTSYWNDEYDEKSYLTLSVAPAVYSSGDFYLGMSLGADIESSDLNVEDIVSGYYTNTADIPNSADHIKDRIWSQADLTARDSGYGIGNYMSSGTEITLVVDKGNGKFVCEPIYINISNGRPSVYTNGLYDTWNNNSLNSLRRENISYQTKGDTVVVKSATNLYLKTGYSVGCYYCVKMGYSDPNPDRSYSEIDGIVRAVVGNYENAALINAQPDIKDKLFSWSNSTGMEGFDFSNGGIDITVLDNYGNIFIQTINVKAASDNPADSEDKPYQSDIYFKVTGAEGITDSYVMPAQHDAYYYKGYQTVFLLDENADTLKNIKPTFETENGSNVYAGKGGNTSLQITGVSEHDFSEEPVEYSVTTKDEKIKNYVVTYVQKHTGGAKLFVNGINKPKDSEENADESKIERVVFLNEKYSNYHDIFIANIGDAEMTGLKVELFHAQNVMLDNYWTVGGENNSTLAAFDTITKDPNKVGELANVAKIRLLPGSASGEVSGTLKISADGQDSVEIELSGIAGTPKITTSTLSNAVKYVPYSALLQTDNIFDENIVSFKPEGELPEGITLFPNGEIYGVPTKTGTFKFNVTMTCRYEDEIVSTESREYTIIVDDNTDENVNNSNKFSGYDIKEPLNENMTSYKDDVFDIEGPLGDFSKLWLDGTELNRDFGDGKGGDYTAEEGSTKITVKSQTFKTAGTGKHTISAEFRDSSKRMRRASQNYTSNVSSGSNNNNNTSHGSSTNTQKPVTKPTPTPEPTPVPEPTPAPLSALYDDVAETDWFYPDVKWAKDKSYMIGVGENKFAPAAQISESMVVQVLSRLAGVDTSQYAGKTYADIPAGQWYTNAALWARENNIIGADAFSALPPCQRGKLAIMLVNYFKSQNIECDSTAEDMVFADSAEMTQEELAAFQTLSKLGVFKGKGNNVMDAHGATTRAELSALLHRVSDYSDAKKTDSVVTSE